MLKLAFILTGYLAVSGGDAGVSGIGLLSQGRPTKQDSVGFGGAPSRAVDGNANGVWASGTSTHTKHPKNSWWQVDLQGTYPIHVVIIHNRIDCCQNRLHGATIFVDKHKCGSVWYLKGRNTYAVNCAGAKGRVVRIEQPKNYLTLAEVQVFGTGGQKPIGSNIGGGDSSMLLSQYKYSLQSSEGHGGNAMRAVDGRTDGVWGKGSVTHSGANKNNWWKVDLYKDYVINMVIVYNRRDCCQDRINGAEVGSNGIYLHF